MTYALCYIICYINSKIITNETFLQNNLIIKNKYFSENYLK